MRWGICKFLALLFVVIDDFEIGVYDMIAGFLRSGIPGRPGRLSMFTRLRFAFLLRSSLFVQLSTDPLKTIL